MSDFVEDECVVYLAAEPLPSPRAGGTSSRGGNGSGSSGNSSNHYQGGNQGKDVSKTGNKDSSKGVGTWRVDLRTKKRKYIDLTGREFTGPEAFLQQRKDKESEACPTRTSRNELRACMLGAVLPSLSWLPSSVSSSTSSAAQTDRTPPTAVPPDHPSLDLASWGVPSRILKRYMEEKVERLFPWQAECLGVDQGAVWSGARNLIYSAPTSGGKTLVSELLMLRRVALRHSSQAPILAKKLDLGTISSSSSSSSSSAPGNVVLFVVPFVALAEQKVAYFLTLT